MEKLIKLVEQSYIKADKENLDVRVGDTVKAHIKVVEGEKVRIQIYEGIVISIRGEGLGKTIKIRKISYGVGVEKTFLIHSPILDKLEIVKHGHPKRAKLFYLRNRLGKQALKVRQRSKNKIQEVPVTGQEEEVQETPKTAEVAENVESVEAVESTEKVETTEEAKTESAEKSESKES